MTQQPKQSDLLGTALASYAAKQEAVAVVPTPTAIKATGDPGPSRDPYTTIDDCIQLANELMGQLRKLGAYKHPLAVRKLKKEVRNVTNIEESQQIRAGSRTYFVDIETMKGEGKRYLKITESRFKGDGKERERNTVIIFPEHVKDFIKVVSEMVGKLGLT
jgi:hypothetical protein